MSKQNIALAHARLGHYIFPVWSVDDCGRCRCGKPNDVPGHKPGKHPQGALAPNGHNDATTDEDMIREWWTRDPDAGIGISLAASGLLAVDIDPRNGGWESLAAIEAEHGKLQSSCVAKTQGGGEHRLFLADASMTVPGQLAPGIDLKHRGYICVEGTRGPDGEYRWVSGKSPLDGAMPSQLPQFLREYCEEHTTSGSKARIRPGSVIVAEETYEELRAALNTIPPDLIYDDWFRVLSGMSRLHLPDMARAITRAWSIQSNKPGHTPEAFDAKWAQVVQQDGPTSYETIFYLADQYDRRWRKSLQQASADLWPEVDLSDLELEPVDYLIDGFLARSLMVLVGKPGMGKSTAMIALCAVVAGVHIPNCQLSAPVKGRKILYITEDTAQFKRNMIAFERNCGIDLRELEKAIVLLPARRVEPQKLIGLKQKIERHTTYTSDGIMLRPWIVFDTISASIHLDDENSNAEVSNALALLKAEFYEAMECSVCLIAHSAKNVQPSEFISDARGAGAWAGDSTLTAGIFDEKGSRYLMLGKRRYSPLHTALQIGLLSTSATVKDRYGRLQEQVLETAQLHWADSSRLEKSASKAGKSDKEQDEKVLRFVHGRYVAALSCSLNALCGARDQIGLGKERLKDSLRRLVDIKLLDKGEGIIGTDSGWGYTLTEAGVKAISHPPT